MTIRVVLALVSVLLLCGAARAQQPTFKMTSFRVMPDGTLSNTASVYHFWISNEAIDSLHAYKFGPYPKFERFLDWKTVSSQVDPEYFDDVPRSFQQFRNQHRIPTRVERYTTIDGQTSLQYIEYATLIDSFLTSYTVDRYDNGTVYLRTIKRHSYTDKNEVAEFTTISESSSSESDTMRLVVERAYDSHGRISMTKIHHYQLHQFSSYDSTTYYYNTDNTLRSVQNCEMQQGRVNYARNILYQGWHEFEAETLPFVNREAGPPVGGTKFTTALISEWSVSDLEWQQPWKIMKSYDEEGRLFSTVVYDMIGRFLSADTVQYYPNGDLNIIFSRHTSQIDTIRKTKYFENEYLPNGDLASSYEGAYDELTWKHVFVYPKAASVYDSSTSGEFGITRGRIVGVQNSAHISITDVAGRSLLNQSISPNWRIPPLPTGLYFISINGGKPRKHLIP